MKDLIVSIMLRLGVSEDVAKKIVEAIPAEVGKPEGVDPDKIVEAAHKKLLSNPAFVDQVKKDVEAKGQGKWADIFERKLRKVFGFTDEQMEGLPEKEGRADALFELAGKVLAEKSKDNGGDKDREITRLNDMLRKLKEEKKKLEEEELPKARKIGEEQRDQFVIDRYLEKRLPGKDGLAVELEFALPGVKAKLLELYDLKVVDGKMVKLRKKGEDLDPTNDTHDVITLDAEIDRIATEGRLRNANGGRAEAGNGNGGNGGGKEKEEPSGNSRSQRGLGRAQEHLKNMAESKKKKAAAEKE